jgi:hypothetical protein
MNVSVAPTARIRAPRKNPLGQQRNISGFQQVAERIGGVAMGAFRIPGALFAGTVVGTYSGARMGASTEHGVTSESVSKGMVCVNVAEGLVKASVGGFLVAGPTGAVVGFAQEAVREAADVFMFVKGGSANSLGTSVHQALSQKVEAGSGTIGGAAKGLAAGAVSATKAGAKTGFNEGKGVMAGTFGAAREIKSEARLAKSLKGHMVMKAARALAGSVSAVLAAPAGLAIGLIQSTSSAEKPLSANKQRLISSGATAATGVALGAFAGPLGMAIGGVVGGVVGLLSAGTRADFQTTIASSMARAKNDDDDLGAEVANKYRDIIQGTGVGALAGMRAGWDTFQADS